MNCADVQQAIREGRGWDPQVAHHTQACAPCAVLLEAGGQLGLALDAWPLDTPGSAEAVWAKVEADRGVRATLRRLSTAQRGLLAGLGLLAVLVGILLIKPRPDLSLYPAFRMVYVVSTFTGLLGVGMWVRLRPLHRPPPLPILKLAAVLVLVAMPFVIAGHPQAETGHPMSMLKGPFWPTAWSCFVFGSATGAVILGLLQLVDRRRRSPIVMVVVGAAVMGVAGNLSLQLYCPVTAPSHLLAGHATVGLLWATVLGLATGIRRLLS